MTKAAAALFSALSIVLSIAVQEQWPDAAAYFWALSGVLLLALGAILVWPRVLPKLAEELAPYIVPHVIPQLSTAQAAAGTSDRQPRIESPPRPSSAS